MDAELGFIPKDSLSSYITIYLCVYSNMEKVNCNRSRETRFEFSSNLPTRLRIRYLQCNVKGLEENCKQVLKKFTVRNIIKKVGNVIDSIKMKQPSGVNSSLISE